MFATSDGLLTIHGYANSNATVSANLGQAGNWFGVVNGNASAIDGTESVTLRFATNSGLFRISHIWTRAKIIISGFASDPGFSDSTGYASDVNYANGTLSYFCKWDAGTEHGFTFENPTASAGRTLRVNVFDSAPGWQATVTRIDYANGNSLPAVADLSATQQTIDNFSASDAWSMQRVGLWSETNRTQIANLLFTTNNGIGLSAWRFNLNAGLDPTVNGGAPTPSWRTGEGFLVTSNQYDWTRQPGQRWFLRKAKESGVDQFIAMIYSPPTNFTRNGHVYGTDGLGTSNLKPDYEFAEAKYIADVLAHFKTNSVLPERVSFDYVMPVNEPYWEWNNRSQEGSRHSNADIIAQAQALRTALDERDLGTEIVLAEAGDLPGLYSVRGDISAKYGATYGDYISAFSGITNLISRNLSAHSYFTDNPTNQLVSVRQNLRVRLDANPHWRYWQSEYCILGARGPGRDLTMATALNVARVMWADLAIANASAWHWWLSLSPADYKDGLLYTDFENPGDAESLYCSKIFWMFGQWSRFIRPGWKRVELPGYDDVFGLMGAAFVNPNTNSIAMVFVNQSGANQRVTPAIANLPSGKIVSHWSPWITSSSPSDNLSPLPPIAAEGECFIPSNAVVTLVGNLIEESTAAAPVIAGLADQSAAAGEVLRMSFQIENSTAPAKLIPVRVVSDNSDLLPDSAISISEEWATNGITREIFVDFSGTNLNQLIAAPAFPNAPSSRDEVSSFESVANLSGTFGSRLRGFVAPPQTGNYTFWISSRDASELYLSADENPATKTRIAWVKNFTAAREWTKEANQQSAPIRLEAGKRYFIEAIHVAANGSDHLEVGWKLPDQTLERPISGARLSPWTDPFANSTRRILSLNLVTNATGTANISVIATDAAGKAATNRFTITVRPPVNPAPTNLNAQVHNGNLLLSWPSDHVGWQLEAQTNPLTSGLTANWTVVDGSTQTSVWTNAIDPKNPAVFYRLSQP
ncbi:MAG TPA: glycoside hydrolase [Verrucomicrobiae bacterium]